MATNNTPAPNTTDGVQNEPTPEQLEKPSTPDAAETPQNTAPADEVNDSPEDTKAKAKVDTESPTLQAQTGPEVVAPIQPEAPTASEVAQALQLGNTEGVVVGDPARKTTYTVSQSDIDRHPELADKQNVSVGDEIDHGKLWIYQYPTADRSNIVQEAWPRDISGGRL